MQDDPTLNTAARIRIYHSKKKLKDRYSELNFYDELGMPMTESNSIKKQLLELVTKGNLRKTQAVVVSVLTGKTYPVYEVIKVEVDLPTTLPKKMKERKGAKRKIENHDGAVIARAWLDEHLRGTHVNTEIILNDTGCDPDFKVGILCYLRRCHDFGGLKIIAEKPRILYEIVDHDKLAPVDHLEEISDPLLPEVDDIA